MGQIRAEIPISLGGNTNNQPMCFFKNVINLEPFFSFKFFNCSPSKIRDGSNGAIPKNMILTQFSSCRKTTFYHLKSDIPKARHNREERNWSKFVLADAFEKDEERIFISL